MGKSSFVLAAFLCVSAFAQTQSLSDPFIWLEDVKSSQSLDWVNARNKESVGRLQSNPIYSQLEPDVRNIVLSKDRVPVVSIQGPYFYNLWQDDTHVRGLWRRVKIEDYAKADIPWETVLDVDTLATQENENWVFGQVTCLPPKSERCLLDLSRGGADASVLREFDTVAKTFVKEGFQVPEAKNTVSWLDENTLLVGSDFGAGSMSTSGYPIVAKLWKRGTPFTSAVEIFRGEVTDVAAGATAYVAPDQTYVLLQRNTTFFSNTTWWLKDGHKIQLPMPETAAIESIFAGRFLYTLRADLKVGSKAYVTGSLVALPAESLLQKNADPLQSLEVIFTPTSTTFMNSVTRAKNALLLSVLDNVHGRVLQVTRESDGSWKQTSIALPGDGMGAVSSADPSDDSYLVSYTDFLTPSSYLLGSVSTPAAPLKLQKQAHAFFDASQMVSEQKFATSRDGTKVPYFIIHKKDIKLDGSNPTLQYGYGGFEEAMTPSYMSLGGKIWLERGGVYVLANIRGGGEYGPAWHTAALRENRQKAYDDFIGVSEDLIRQKITSPAKLAIQGGSNGGLLTGAVFVERPDLYRAVISEVPLLDMIRYPLLGAGASWMEEYGDPNDPQMRQAILKYSPYQNMKPDVQYPEVFFLSSTEDDRVTPAHARKLVALMQSYKHPVLYWENMEGGHHGSANLEQKITWATLEYTYLWSKLGESKP